MQIMLCVYKIANMLTGGKYIFRKEGRNVLLNDALNTFSYGYTGVGI